MRGIKVAVGCVVGLAMLLGLGLVADRWARAEAEARILERIEQALPEFSGDLEVEVGGTLAIPQLLRGSLHDVQVRSPQATVASLTAANIWVRASGVPIRGGSSVHELTVSAHLPPDTVIGSLIERPDDVTVSLGQDQILAETAVLGVTTVVAFDVVPEQRAIAVTIASVRVAGAQVDVDDIPVDVTDLLTVSEISLDMLPAALTLDTVDVSPDGVEVALSGTDVSIG